MVMGSFLVGEWAMGGYSEVEWESLCLVTSSEVDSNGQVDRGKMSENPETENPFLSPLEKGNNTEVRFLTKRRVLLVCSMIALCVVLIAMLLPLQRRVPEAARRTSCLSNLRMIALALHNYETEHGALPPAYTVDEDGKPLHSWRTLILPYLEQDQLYESIDLTKPWDDPVNARAKSTTVALYVCPSVSVQPGFTTYLANAWEKGAFEPGGKGRTFADFEDGLSRMIAVLEVPAEMAVPWMSPHDVDPEMFLRIAHSKSGSNHPGSFNVAFANAVTRSLQLHDIEDHLPFLTIADGDSVKEND